MEEMTIHLHDDSSKFDYKFWHLNTMALIDTGECGRFQVNPDVEACEPMENDDTIYSVECFGKIPLLTDINELFIFGFPSYQNVTNNGRYRVKDGISFAVKTFTIFENYSYKYKGESEKVDSIDYKITIKDKTVTDSLKGYSGSPVFGRGTKNRNGYFWDIMRRKY